MILKCLIFSFSKRVAPLFQILLCFCHLSLYSYSVHAQSLLFGLSNPLELSKSLDIMSKSLPASFITNPNSSPDKRKDRGNLEETTSPDKTMPFNLKRKAGESKNYHQQEVNAAQIKEPDCVKSTFMSPFHHPVNFSLTTTDIYSRYDKTCRWNFFGTEVCIPMLSCNTSKLILNCDHEYLEIVDGVGGELQVCAGKYKQVSDIQASGDMRDLYLKYKVVKSGEKNDGHQLFTCSVVCSQRGQGTSLPRVFENTVKNNPKCFCGTKPKEDRIINGETAKKFEFPWLVALVETNTRQPFCGGSILNNRFILTAAHCLKGKFGDYRNIQILVNGHHVDMTSNTAIMSEEVLPIKYTVEEIEKMDRSNGSRRYNLEELIVHPLYISETNDYDIALVKLAEDIDLVAKAAKEAGMESLLQQPRSICLPPLASYLRTYAGKKAVVAGWGLPDVEAEGSMTVLNKLEVNVFSQRECKEMFAYRVNRRIMCAGWREGGKDSCAGDSGGPLVREERPRVWVQIGSVSFGEGCGEPDHPGVYFRTTEGQQWMHYQANYNGGNKDDGGNDTAATWCLTPP